MSGPAHIVGLPVEETIAMAAPVLGMTCAAIMATLADARRRRASRRDAAKRRV